MTNLPLVIAAFVAGFCAAIYTGEADLRNAFGLDNGPRFVQAR